MIISLSPIRMDDALTLERQGDTLVLNGEALDLSGVPEGAILPQDAVDCAWLASDIRRIDGTLHLGLLMPYAGNAPASALFPDPIEALSDGPIALPTQAFEVL
ncbi:MAG: hypothetical protein H6899_10035 [Rhodobacter sp.]|nr:hypothetical protein [Rhodobacter sp.]